MRVGIKNKSSESRFPSKYQNSLRSDHPLVSYKYLIFSKFSSPFSPQMVESGKRLYQVNFVQLPDTPTNFHRLSTSRSTKLAKALNPSPNSPKESESSTVTAITYLRHLLILSTKLHPDSSTLSVFQDFRFPLQLPPMSTDLVGI